MRILLMAAGALCFVACGCSRYTAEEYFAKGQQQLEEARHRVDTMSVPTDVKGMFQPALESFTSITTEYPQSPLAEQALFIVATIQNNDVHEPQVAVETFSRYIGRYPDGKQAPLAMFLIGYLYNNELHDTSKAGPAYRSFLAKYPNDEMALSAQAELNTLGKAPEELIPKQVAEAKPSPSQAATKKAPLKGRTK